MFCSKCGKQIDNNKFCPFCGSPAAKMVAPVVKPVSQSETAPVAQQNGMPMDNVSQVMTNPATVNQASISQTPVKKGKTGIKILIAVLIIAILAAGGFCLYRFVLSDDGESGKDKESIHLADKGNIKEVDDVNSENIISDDSNNGGLAADAGVVSETDYSDSNVSGSGNNVTDDSINTDENITSDDSINPDENITSDDSINPDDSITSDENVIPDDDKNDIADETDHTHTFWLETGTVCQICGLDFPVTVTPEENYYYAIQSGVAVRDFYYNTGKVLRYLKKGEAVCSVNRIENYRGNTFVELDEGGYVFLGNLSEEIVEVDDDDWHSHEFEPDGEGGDICTICGFVFQPEFSEYMTTLYVVRNDTSIRDYYYNNGNVIRTASKGEALNVYGTITNEKGSVWYILEEGGYVYSLNVSDIPPVNENDTDA